MFLHYYSLGKRTRPTSRSSLRSKRIRDSSRTRYCTAGSKSSIRKRGHKKRD
jgi:hypothetical protein